MSPSLGIPPHSLLLTSSPSTLFVVRAVFILCLLSSLSSSQDIQKGVKGGEKGCSFESSGCTYNIYLTQGEKGSQSVQRLGDGGSNCGQANQRVLLDDQAQNDYTAKLDNIEKSFTYYKDAHENRLKELEGTIQNLVRTSINDKDSSYKDRKTRAGVEKLSFGNKEFMKKLEDEFEKLRRELRDKSTELMDTREKLNETSMRMHEEQMERFKTSQDLLNAENQITMLKRERAVLKNQLKDRSFKLRISSDQATECEQKSITQQDEIMELFRSEATVKEELLTAQLRLNRSASELTMLQEKHKAIKSRMDRIRRIMKIRENELIACYSAKTSTFCGFEDPKLCGFTNINDTSDFFDWERARGKTPSSRTGPSMDHTCEADTGHFMFIEASAKGKGNNAILYSPLYRGLKEQCVEFFYHMYGRHIGTLNVYAQARGDRLRSAWRAYGNQGDHWTNARLAIPKALARAGYQIAFEGITQNGFQGDISIDDVSVTDGPCPTIGKIQPVRIAVNSTLLEKLQTDKFSRRLRRKQKKRGRGRNKL